MPGMITGGRWNGINIRLTDPNAMERVSCTACSMDMEVKRGVIGPTSWAGALARKEREHDYWACPNNELDWHDQIVGLIQEKQGTISRTLKALIQIDIDAIRDEHVADDA